MEKSVKRVPFLEGKQLLGNKLGVWYRNQPCKRRPNRVSSDSALRGLGTWFSHRAIFRSSVSQTKPAAPAASTASSAAKRSQAGSTRNKTEPQKLHETSQRFKAKTLETETTSLD